MKHRTSLIGKQALDHGSEGRGPSRREVLAMLSAVGSGAVLAPAASIAQTIDKGPRIIDAHHHIFPLEYTAKNMKPLIGDARPLMNLQLSIGMTSNPRTWPILDGHVTADGIDLVPSVVNPSELFWR